jgi:hypothetical protein
MTTIGQDHTIRRGARKATLPGTRKGLKEKDDMKINHRDEAPRLFGTGAAPCVGAECNLDVPESYDLEYLDCYFDIDGQSVLAAGQTAFTVTFDPNATPWVIPVAVSSTVIDSVDPQLDQMAFLTGVGVHGCFQENINETTPTAATTRMWPSSKWDPRNRAGCACPICWDIYSNAANTRLLQIFGFNPNPAGTTERIILNVYGAACGGPPADCTGGAKKPRKKRVPPLVGGSGNLVGNGGRGSAVPL